MHAPGRETLAGRYFLQRINLPFAIPRRGFDAHAVSSLSVRKKDEEREKNTMKRILALCCALVLALGMLGCATAEEAAAPK